MIKQVLVVGGAGYIGGAVTDALAAKGIPFTVYDNLTFENHYLKPVDFIYGDIRDRVRLGSLLERYSHIIWLAALVGDGACAVKPELTYEINESALAWLAGCFSGRILFTSTCSVYGASPAPVTETSPLNPLSVYAHTKREAEKHLIACNACIVRLGTAFGIPDHFSRIRMDLAINYMTMHAAVKGKLTILGGSQWRPFIHVKDIASALAALLSRDDRGVFNLATENTTIDKVGALIQEETGCVIEVKSGEFQDARNYHADTAKARTAHLLSETTSFDIRYGIREIKDLVLSRRVRDFGHELYSNERYLTQTISQYERGFPMISV